MSNGLLIDDRLLITQLLAQPVAPGPLTITSLWYYRACRAAVLGAGGQLSGPFQRLEPARQREAIRQLLQLPEDIALAHPRSAVPEMARLAERHRRLNVMNLEAVAAALVYDLAVALSPAAAAGVLPGVLDAEQVSWSVIDLG